jgi:hypothetical protein
VGTGVGRKAILRPRRFWSGRKKAGRREKKEFATKVAKGFMLFHDDWASKFSGFPTTPEERFY